MGDFGYFDDLADLNYLCDFGDLDYSSYLGDFGYSADVGDFCDFGCFVFLVILAICVARDILYKGIPT